MRRGQSGASIYQDFQETRRDSGATSDAARSASLSPALEQQPSRDGFLLHQNLKAFTHSIGNDEVLHSQQTLHGFGGSRIRELLHFIQDPKADQKVFL